MGRGKGRECSGERECVCRGERGRVSESVREKGEGGRASESEKERRERK